MANLFDLGKDVMAKSKNTSHQSHVRLQGENNKGADLLPYQLNN
jgi:hypothetical protein